MQEIPIWKDRDSLLENYIPPTLPGREEEIDQLTKFISLAKIGKPPDLLVTGPTGTGKTAIVKYVFRKLHGKIPNCELIYVTVASPLNTLSTIAEELGLKWQGIRRVYNGIPRGVSIDEALLFIKRGMKSKGIKKLVIAMDEVDRLAGNPNGEWILYNFTRILPVSLVLITNKPMFLDRIEDERVISTLRPKYISLSDYTTPQIYEILKYRASLAFKDNTISQEVLKKIVELTIKETGSDVRFALDILLSAGDMAYSEDSREIEIRHILKSVEYARVNSIHRMISKLNSIESALLYLIAKKGEISCGSAYNFLRWEFQVSLRRLKKAARTLRLLEFIEQIEKKKLGYKRFFFKWTGIYDAEIIKKAVGEIAEIIEDEIKKYPRKL